MEEADKRKLGKYQASMNANKWDGGHETNMA